MSTFSSPIGQLSDEDSRLLKRLSELSSRAENASPAFSPYLTPREQYLASHLLPKDDTIRFFWGGYPDAERKILCFLPSYYAFRFSETPDEAMLASLVFEELSPYLSAVLIRGSGYVSLSHRDYMGAILSLGLDRSVVGDILVSEQSATVILTENAARFLKDTLTGIGRDKVRVTDTPLPTSFERTFEKVSGTVASARLDCVVAELANTSREKAKELILAGQIEHHYFPASACDAPVTAGDTISIRKNPKIRAGKFLIDSLDDKTAKGRLKLVGRKYLT